MSRIAVGMNVDRERGRTMVRVPEQVLYLPTDGDCTCAEARESATEYAAIVRDVREALGCKPGQSTLAVARSTYDQVRKLDSKYLDVDRSLNETLRRAIAAEEQLAESKRRALDLREELAELKETNATLGVRESNLKNALVTSGDRRVAAEKELDELGKERDKLRFERDELIDRALAAESDLAAAQSTLKDRNDIIQDRCPTLSEAIDRMKRAEEWAKELASLADARLKRVFELNEERIKLREEVRKATDTLRAVGFS